MFGSIGMPELIVIFVIALIIFGPAQAARARPLARQEHQRIQARLERAEEHPRRGNPGRGAARDRAAAAAEPAPSGRRPTNPASTKRRRALPARLGQRIARAWRSFRSPVPHAPVPRRRPAHPAHRSRRPRRWRRREDVVSGAPRRAPEAPDRVRLRPRRRLCDRVRLRRSHPGLHLRSRSGSMLPAARSSCTRRASSPSC